MGETTGISWTDHTFVRAATSGPQPKPPRSGDKMQARQRVNVEVRSGRRAHPNTLPCVDCGHVWTPGERRHEYDHHLGYEAEHHADVEAVCTNCHARRTAGDACPKGHAFTAENTEQREGRRRCRTCTRARDRKRAPRRRGSGS